MHSVVFPQPLHLSQDGRNLEGRAPTPELVVQKTCRPRRGKEKGGEMIGGACVAKTGAAAEAAARKPSVKACGGS